MRLESGLSLHHSMSLFARGSLSGCTVLTVVNSPYLVPHVLCSSGPKDGGGSQPEGLKLFTGDVVLSLRELSGCALGGVVLSGSLDTFYIKVLNIFIYVNFFFFSISRGISFSAPEGGRLKVFSLRPLFPDEEVEAPGGKVICYSSPDGHCLQDFFPLE